MSGWEHCTIDMSAVAFGEIPRMLTELERRGWEVSPLQSAGAATGLRLDLRRPVKRWMRLRGWLRVAG
jgi:hypothetical protein